MVYRGKYSEEKSSFSEVYGMILKNNESKIKPEQLVKLKEPINNILNKIEPISHDLSLPANVRMLIVNLIEKK